MLIMQKGIQRSTSPYKLANEFATLYQAKSADSRAESNDPSNALSKSYLTCRGLSVFRSFIIPDTASCGR